MMNNPRKPAMPDQPHHPLGEAVAAWIVFGLMMLTVTILLIAMAIAQPALAQDIVPTTPSTFLYTMLGLASAFIVGVVAPLAWLKGRQLITEQKLKNAQLEEQLRGTLDAGAQKAIGGALGKIDIPEGKLTGQTKTDVVKEASDALAKNFPDAFAALGVENPGAKAKEIVESRLGMMDAQAAGTPVPNPSQPVPTPAAPSTQNVTVTPAKK